ncbi:hypothetical protein TSA6c_15385 [Azospirillum sp. TSA6c]|nr:hypothetical protein TSA6c_15385 [Azospirillum sp. TSA6c]
MTDINGRTHIGDYGCVDQDRPGSFKATAGMKRLGHIFAVLAFAFALLMGAAGGAMAHVDTPVGSMDHHGSHHAPSPSTPSQTDHHKAAIAVAATCCPAAEAPARHTITLSLMVTEASWHPRADYIPNARDIAPDTPPPKTSL